MIVLIVEVVLNRLSKLRIDRKEYSKATPVCEYWCGLCSGNSIAWERLGIVYLRRGFFQDAIEALEKVKNTNNVHLLSEAYLKTGNHLALISLMLDFPSETLNWDQLKSSYYSLGYSR